MTKRLTRTTEMKILRTIACKTLRKRIRNDIIREMCGVRDVVRWGRQRRHQWNNHVGKMDVEGLAG